MTDSDPSDAPDGLPASRRDLLKGVFFGGITVSGSRLDTAKALLLGGSVATDSEGGASSAEFSIGANSPWNPIPVRATESASVRDIAKNTSNVNGPPYRLTDVAKQRGLLDSPHPDNPREEPPFALRELITSQVTSSNKTDRSESGWTNWVGDWGSGNDLTEYKPENKRELVEAIIESARAEEKIRAVGAGHSHSNVAVPDKNFIRLSWYDNGVKGLVSRNRKRWMSGSTIPEPVQVEAGAPIRYLARKLLLDEGLALQNRGSFDAQTLAGAINTSTHGTGAGLGALSDSVRSVELATVVESPAQEGKPLVRLFRVEPENGLTIRPDFEREVGTHETTLIQDDDVFHSVVVGYGCMGVAYSYTIDVREKYWLYEQNVKTKWNSFKNNIDTLREPPENYNSGFEPFDPTDSGEGGSRHFQFLLNLSMAQQAYNTNTQPGKIRLEPNCLVISHREPHKYANNGNSWPRWQEQSNIGKWPGDNWPPERKGKSDTRKYFESKFGRSFHPLFPPENSAPGINKYFGKMAKDDGPFEGPDKSNKFRRAGGGVPRGKWSASFVALKRPKEYHPDPPWDKGPVEPPLAISTEIAVPADEVVKAVEAVIDRVNNHPLTFHVPMGVRFVDRSEHFLAPEYAGPNDPPGPVAKVEVPYTVETFKGVSGPGADVVSIPRKDPDEKDMLTYAKEALAAVEAELITMSGNDELAFARPHMGKTNTIGVTDGKSDLRKHYEKFETWQTVHEAFDPFGTFNNGFTDSKGISIDRD